VALDGYFGSPWDDHNNYPIAAGLNGIIADLWRIVTGWQPKSWFAITLPEPLLISKVKMYNFEVNILTSSSLLKIVE